MHLTTLYPKLQLKAWGGLGTRLYTQHAPNIYGTCTAGCVTPNCTCTCTMIVMMCGFPVISQWTSDPGTEHPGREFTTSMM